jgi:hypothetical protein
LLAVVVSTLALIAPASATEDLPPGGSFTDDNRIAEEGYIEAIAALGVTRGCNPPTNDRFCPDKGVTRAQMASFFVRALDLSGNTETPFTDTSVSVHEQDIAALFAVGITKGCNPPDNDEYCPERVVTRGEMAAFIARAWDYTGEVDRARFSDDDSSIFEADISRIADAGITHGCGDGRYCPNEPMLRRHMAVFLGRALGLSPIAVPPPPETIGSFTTYYDRCSDPCRVTNIQLIADAIDGTVVQPGEIFSVNDHVGKRTVEKGYVVAGAIIGGELYCCDHPANVGGGTSQFATTLYNAVFFAGLEDIYHRPHSIWFSRYPMGREATLGYTSPDVRFRNDTEFPVTIKVSYTETQITVAIVGITTVVNVQSILTGSATTLDGGTVTIMRIITLDDGSTQSQMWTHTYRGLPPSDDDPPPPPPPDEDGGGGGPTPL